MKRIGWKVYGAVLLVFLLGAVSGSAASYGFSQREQRGLVAGEHDAFERRRLGGLESQLDLSAEQREKVANIFRQERENRRKLTREAFERCGQPLEEHRSKTDALIRGVLTPAQQQRFDELRKTRPDEPFGGHGPRRHRQRGRP